MFWIEICLMLVVSIRFLQGASQLPSLLDADDSLPEEEDVQKALVCED